MPTPADIRRRNLRKLVERDTLAVASRRMKKPERQINDMISEPPRKSFGEKVARSMEEAYDPSMPAGWLDRDDGAPLPETRIAEPVAQYAVQRNAQSDAITADEAALLRDLRELLPEKRDRYAETIRREADEARAYKAMVVERYGEAVADEVVAKYISPAPVAAPRAPEPQTLPGPVIDGDKAIRSGTLSWYSTAPRANAQKTRARK